MPTYEYECEKCGHHFERFQKMTDEPVKRCPECRGKARRLLGTGAGLIFKGKGFYQTDYRSKSYKEAEKKEMSESSPASHAEAGTSAKKDEKKTSSAEKASSKK